MTEPTQPRPSSGAVDVRRLVAAIQQRADPDSPAEDVGAVRFRFGAGTSNRPGIGRLVNLVRHALLRLQYPVLTDFSAQVSRGFAERASRGDLAALEERVAALEGRLAAAESTCGDRSA